jgi:hypothetical protein
MPNQRRFALISSVAAMLIPAVGPVPTASATGTDALCQIKAPVDLEPAGKDGAGDFRAEDGVAHCLGEVAYVTVGAPGTSTVVGRYRRVAGGCVLPLGGWLELRIPPLISLDPHYTRMIGTSFWTTSSGGPFVMGHGYSEGDIVRAVGTALFGSGLACPSASGTRPMLNLTLRIAWRGWIVP